MKSIVGSPYTEDWHPVRDPKKDKAGKGELCIRFAIDEEGRAKLDAAYGHSSRPAVIGGDDTRVKISEEQQKKIKKQKSKEPKERKKEPKKKKKEITYDRQEIPNLRIRVAAAKELSAADPTGSSDPYVVVQVPDTKVKHKTKTIKKTLNPVWNEEFDMSQDHIDAENDVMRFSIYDWDRATSKDLLGVVEVHVSELLGDEPVDKWFQVMDPEDTEKEGQGELHIMVAHGDLTLPAIPSKKPKKGDKKKGKDDKKKAKESKKKAKDDKKKAKDDKKKADKDDKKKAGKGDKKKAGK